jgi:transcription antitermination factor NusG
MAVACSTDEKDVSEMRDSAIAWYAVRVRTRQEALVADALTRKGYDVLLPQYRCRKRWSDRVKEVTLPLFPGYLFARLDVRRRLPLLVTPGVLHMVSAGDTILAIDPEEIAAIERVVAAGTPAEPWPYLHIGQRVRIEGGPLHGLEGLLAAVDDHHRVVVSVTLLQRSVAVQIAASQAFPVGADDHVIGFQAWEASSLAVSA